jgi:hypothetical protein
MSAKSQCESDTLTSSILVGFPKVNLVSILAGILALVSVFLPWWGLDGSAFGVAASVRWSLWGRPYLGDPSSSQAIAQATWTMGLVNVMVLVLVFVTAAITFLGSFGINKTYLITGFMSAILAIAVYAGGVSYTIGNSCQGTSSCISGPVGSTIVSGITVSWGFQVGFYLFLVGAVLALFAIIFHQVFVQRTTTRDIVSPSVATGGVRFCSGCGHPLQADAKFCSHCARPAPTT